jgi:hypothetical protein
MRSSYELVRKPRPADLRATVLHMAVSMFDDGDRASSTRSTSHSRVWAAQIRLAAVGFEALLRSHDEGLAAAHIQQWLGRPTMTHSARGGRSPHSSSSRRSEGSATGP